MYFSDGTVLRWYGPLTLNVGLTLEGYMMKKGHKRKNWIERWFLLRPDSVAYYVSEDLLEKKGDIKIGRASCRERV